MNIAKAISVASDGFFMLPPRGISVLLVDSDSTCLEILSKMLRSFGYEVLTAKLAADAFFIAQGRESKLDLILAETHLPDMGKFELLEKPGEMSELPVIVMSADDDECDVIGALFKGAKLYLVKPITVTDIKHLWQFAFRKKDKIVANKGVSGISSDVTDNQIPLSKGQQRHQDAKRKVLAGVDRNEEEVYSSVLKKPKLTWSSELHSKFVQAVKEIGIDGAHPKTIRQHMNVPGLKKESISSHLQKYRLALKREQDAIGKAMNERNSDSQVALCNLSSTASVQGCLVQNPEMQTMSTCHHPEFGSKEQTNFFIPMPSIGSMHLLHNGELSCNDESSCVCGEFAPATNQIDFYYPCSHYAHAGIGITSNEKLADFHQMEEFLNGKMDPFNYVNPGQEVAIELQSSLIPQEEETDQQQQNLFPPEPAPVNPGEYGIYGAQHLEIDELFDMRK